MENLDKLRILIQHWIEHNHGHAEEFAKWQKLMIEDNEPIAGKLAQTITMTEEINNLLKEALQLAGGTTEHHHHHH